VFAATPLSGSNRARKVAQPGRLLHDAIARHPVLAAGHLGDVIDVTLRVGAPGHREANELERGRDLAAVGLPLLRLEIKKLIAKLEERVTKRSS